MNTFYNLFSHDSNGDICWNIYSVGDPMFLQNVFNALGMMSNSGYISALVVIGGMLGVILMGFSSIITQKGFDLGTFTVCCIVSIFMFTETAHVNVHDVFSDEDRDVQNVPYGVAVAGSVISTLGMGIADLFEQGFHDVNSNATLTGAGSGNGNAFASPLYILNALARAGHTEGVFAAIDKANGGSLSNDGTDGGGMKPDFRQSAINYFKDCTMTGIALRKYTWSDIWHGSFGSGSSSSASGRATANTNDPVVFNSKVYYTRICPGGACQNMTCLDAYSALDKMIMNGVNAGSGGLKSFLNAQLDQTREKVSNLNLGISDTSNPNAYEEIGSQALTVMNIAAADMMSLFKASLWEEIAFIGQESYFQDARDVQSALMIEQARRQRNVQNASEGEMFRNSIRPMMTFIEGFTYAVTPIAAMLIMMGAFGLKLALKYFTLLIWVQSWLPCMAIVNNYIITSARRGMLELGGISNSYSFGSAADSMYAIDKITEVTQDYISMGGMMLAAVPVLTLFLFTGSVYALAQLTARMHGGDLVNEQMLEPSAEKMGAALNQGDLLNTYDGVGVRGGSTPTSMSFSYGLSNMTSQLHGKMVASQDEFGSQVATAYAESYTNTEGKTLSSVVNQAVQSMNGTEQKAMNQVQTALRSVLGNSVSESDLQNLSTTLSANSGTDFNAAIGKMIGLSAKAGLGLEQKFGSTENLQKALQSSRDLSNAFNTAKELGVSGQLAGHISSQLGDGIQFGHQQGLNGTTAASLSHSAKKAYSDTNQYSEAKSRDSGVSVTHSYTVPEIQRNLQNIGADRAALDYLYSEFGKTQIHAMRNQMERSGRTISGNADLAAGLELAASQIGKEGDETRATIYGYMSPAENILGNQPLDGPQETPEIQKINADQIDQERLAGEGRAMAGFGEAKRAATAPGWTSAERGAAEGKFDQGKQMAKDQVKTNNDYIDKKSNAMKLEALKQNEQADRALLANADVGKMPSSANGVNPTAGQWGGIIAHEITKSGGGFVVSDEENLKAARAMEQGSHLDAAYEMQDGKEVQVGDASVSGGMDVVDAFADKGARDANTIMAGLGFDDPELKQKIAGVAGAASAVNFSQRQKDFTSNSNRMKGKDMYLAQRDQARNGQDEFGTMAAVAKKGTGMDDYFKQGGKVGSAEMTRQSNENWKRSTDALGQRSADLYNFAVHDRNMTPDNAKKFVGAVIKTAGGNRDAANVAGAAIRTGMITKLEAEQGQGGVPDSMPLPDGKID